MRWLWVLLLGMLMVLVRADEEIRLGIEPYFSPRQLITSFQSLRDELAVRMGKPVIVLTAPNYREFVLRLQQGEFDVAVIGPHTARMLQLQGSYQPLLKGVAKLSGVIVVRKDSPIRELSQLEGQLLAMPDALTLTSMLGEELLRKQGINAKYRYHTYHNAAAMAVLRGEVVAAVVNNTAFAHMPSDLREGVAVIAETRSMPHMMLLLRSNETAEMRKRYLTVLMQFLNSSEHGKSFIGKIGFHGVEVVKDGDMQLLDPFVAELRRRLAGGE